MPISSYTRLLKIGSQSVETCVYIPQRPGIEFKSRIDIQERQANIPASLTIRQLSTGEVRFSCQAGRTLTWPPAIRVRLVPRASLAQPYKIVPMPIQVSGIRVRIRPSRAVFVDFKPCPISVLTPATPIRGRRNVTFHLRGLTAFRLGQIVTATLSNMPVSLERFADAADSINSELRMWHCKVSDMAKVRETARAVCALLGFATSTPIRIARTFVDDAQSILQISINDLHRDPIGTARAPQLIPNADVESFLKATLHAIPLAPYPLNEVMDLLVDARQTTTMEVAALILANVLEIYRYNYLHRIAIPTNRVRTSRDRLIWSSSGDVVNFEPALKDFCSHHKLKHWRSQFKDIRNSIIHEGRIKSIGAADAREAVARLQFFCEYVTIKLLANHRGMDFIRFDKPFDANGIALKRNTSSRGY